MSAGSLREVLTGGALRVIMGMKDLGESFLAKVENVDGGDHYNHEGDKDIWAHYTDVMTGLPGIARLFIPGNILFSTPEDGDSAMVTRGADTSGPGAPYMFFGDGGVADRFPSWDLAAVAGLFSKAKKLMFESKDEDIELKVSAAGKKILHSAGTTTITVNKDGSVVIDANGTTITMESGGNATIDVGSNKLYVGSGSGTQPMLMGDDVTARLNELKDAVNACRSDLMSAVKNHTHPFSGTTSSSCSAGGSSGSCSGTASGSTDLASLPSASEVAAAPAQSTIVENA